MMQRNIEIDRIQLLECTIRDGALGLEDAWINDVAHVSISESERYELGEIIASTDADIIEVGSIEISEQDKRCFDIYQNIEQASKAIPKNKKPGQLFVAMFRGPDTPIEELPTWREGLLDGVRVIIRYSELVKSLEFCEELSRKGFKVFIQPMATMRYKEEELDLLVYYANRMKAYALYFVDSYGYMMPEDIIRFTKKYDAELDPQIRIGFHAHNNMNMAFANAVTFLKSTDRKIIVDSTASGMGQGAGNLQTEIIVDYLNKNFNKKYNYESVLEACDYVERYNENGLWGYSVMRLIPAVHGVAYKYAIYLRKTYKLPYVQIQRLLEILDTMPNEMRFRYTSENVKKLLEIGKIQVTEER